MSAPSAASARGILASSLVALVPLVSASCGDCGGQGGDAAAPGASAPGASASGSSASGRPPGLSPAEVARVVNPGGRPPYEGPTGTLRGKVRVEGPKPPDSEFKFPPQCGAAAETYGKLFRVGEDGGLADVLVGVNGPEKTFVPAKEEVVRLPIRGCALPQRTIAITFGQRLEVENEDATESYMPHLSGVSTGAVLVAVPKGAPVPLFTPKPGRYQLVDALAHPFLRADVYALPYALHAVTDVEGRYEVRGIPVGRVRVGAIHPGIDASKEELVEIKQGENVHDLTLTYTPAK